MDPVFVLMTPVFMAAWKSCEGMSYLHSLFHGISWQQREENDCAVLALRALLARSVLGKQVMTLQQLILGIPHLGSQAAPSQMLSRRVLLPDAKQLELTRVNKKLKPAGFRSLLQEFINNPRSSKYAFVGPGNHKADAWLFFKQQGSRLPLTVYVSCKQRKKGSEGTVTGLRIMEEMEKDMLLASGECDFVYVYVTDEKVLSVPEVSLIPNLVVIGPEHHQEFYGSISSTLKLAKEL
jgi:hypothetical protein